MPSPWPGQYGPALENTFRGGIEAGLEPPERGAHVTPRRAWTPFQAPRRPPVGYYDPNLDAQERAAGRGLTDLILDADRAGERGQSDYLLAKGDINRQGDEGLFDLDTSHRQGKEDFGLERSDITRGAEQGLADLLSARTRGEEDHRRATEGLVRNYGILGSQQGQAARAAGVASGGALSQAAAKRAANQGLEQGGLDLARGRFLADSTQAEGRLTEDRDTGLARLLTREGRFNDATGLSRTRMTEARDRALGQLGTQQGRSVEDRTTALDRARRENTFFGNDIAASRWFQSRGLWTPPTRPRNEIGTGQSAVRVETKDGVKYVVDQFGRRRRVGPQGGAFGFFDKPGRGGGRGVGSIAQTAGF
jgi:hypothetical protein